MNLTTTDRLLEKLEELLNSGKKQMFSNMRLVDANSCLAIIQQIKSQLPGELAEAVVVLRDCDKLKEEAMRDADAIIAGAQEQAKRLVAESEILRESERQASDLVKGAGAYADNLVEQSYIQVNNLYIEVENVMREMLNTVASNRERLFVDENAAQEDPENQR